MKGPTGQSYNDQHCTEAYATWFCAHGNKPPVWRKMMAHFTPHTDNAFREMTDTWLKRTTTQATS
jgi:hypothetical protein